MCQERKLLKITVQRLIKADIAAVWKAWNSPDDVVQNFARYVEAKGRP